MIPIDLTLQNENRTQILVNPSAIEYVFRAGDDSVTHVCFPGENNVLYVREQPGEILALIERAAGLLPPGPLSLQPVGTPPDGPASDAGHGLPSGGDVRRCSACSTEWSAQADICPECGTGWHGDSHPVFTFAAARDFETPRQRLERIVGEAIGAGSVCWESLSGTGVFQSEKAVAIVRALVAEVDLYVRARIRRSAAVDAVADVLHEATCKENQHDGPEGEWPCVSLASEALQRVPRV